MFRSMTAYGRAHQVTGAGSFLIEIHSVNRKSLDITIHLPKELLLFDMDFRKALAKEIKRGAITVRLTREESKGAEEKELPDLALLEQIKIACEERGAKLGYAKQEMLSFKELLDLGFNFQGRGEQSVDASLLQELMKGFQKALQQFIAMREKEGEMLFADIHPRLDAIEKFLAQMMQQAPQSPKRYQEKLEKRLKELEMVKGEDEERMMRELALFAEKVDITEELTRLDAHVKQFRERILSQKISIGRELDFIIQEMNREVNTSAAKAQDLDLTQTLLLIKSELDKIREQIQNVE